MRFKYFLLLVAFSPFFCPSLSQAGEKEFAALFVRAHHDFADQGASIAIKTLDKAIKEADNQASRDLANTFLFALLKSEGSAFSDNTMYAKESVQLLKRAIKIRPDDPTLYEHLGYSYCTLNQKQKCISSLSSAINVAKRDKKALYYSARATTYTLHLNRPDLALQDRITARDLFRKFGNFKMADVEDRMIKGTSDINLTEFLREAR